MKKKLFKTITKTLTAVALAAVISTPAFAYTLSASNTVTTNKSSWVASMHNYKQSNNKQETSVILYSGKKGHNNAVTQVKVGALFGNSWERVIEPEEGYYLSKDNKKHTYALTRTVSAGRQMRIRLKLANVAANSGFNTDTVTHAWYFN